VTEILLCGDLHLSDRAPSNCTDSYNDDLFTMLWEIVEMAGLNEPDAVVFAGDLFHLKQANRTSHSTVQRMIEIVQAFTCPVYLVVGNHDIQHDRVESIHETQPFGVLLKAGAHLLDGWAEDLPLYGVSWQQHWDRDCSGAFEAWRTNCGLPDELGHRDSALLVTHAPIYPPGQELPWENVPASTIADWMSNQGSCYYGHVHDLHGTFIVDGVTFCNQGALSRGSLHESDLTRRPAVTLWRSDPLCGQQFERIELKTAKPAEEVFRLAAAEERANYAGRLEAFLSAIGASSVEVASIESVLAHVRGMDLPDAVVGLAEEVLTLASHGELK
jgi:calcineurin-like phosphoesterase family protein